jgi:dienelactone hydrolase
MNEFVNGMINPYAYIRQDNQVECRLREQTKLWTRYSVSFPSACYTSYLDNNRILGEYIVPAGKARAPLAILVHGMGDRSIIPCKLISRTLARHGIASFILFLVFHTYRASDIIRNKYPRLSAEEWFESYQVSVTDVRQVVDWAVSRPELDINKISVLGISYGSFISSIAMALDDRIKAGILIEAGGNSDKITRNSLVLRRQYKHDEEIYRQNQDCYAQYLEEVAEKGFENVVALNSSFLTDPLTFSVYLRDRPLFMINALFDEMIPRVATLELWEACGKPPIRWYPATHASIWLLYPLIGPRIAAFLKSVKGC